METKKPSMLHIIIMKEYSGVDMLKYHNTSELEGKVSANLLDNYKTDYKNPIISSIIAGFHRAYGLRNEGTSISLEILNNIDDDTDNICHRNILVWNLYILSGEYIDEGIYDEAMHVARRAENNWTRDVILGDEMGVYHVSWLEQIWQRQAEIYLLSGERNNFEIITDKILSSRLDFFSKAEEITGENILRDRCTYNCLELIAFEKRKRDIEKALEIIKEAVFIKAGIQYKQEFQSLLKLQKDNKLNLCKNFDVFLKYYYSIHDISYDNLTYSYCKACKYFENGKLCLKRNMECDAYKACSEYSN